MLSKYQLKIVDFYNISVSNVKKLVPNSKEKYVLPYGSLQFYLRLGLKFKKKIHWILELNQSQWLKPYMEFNTKKNRSRKKWR